MLKISQWIWGLCLAGSVMSVWGKAVPVQAPSWAVVDEQGHLIAGAAYSVARPIASITKLMMAMVYLDVQPDLNVKERIEQGDIDTIKKSSSRLPVGAILSRMDMLRLALVASENRAASALGRSYPGGAQSLILAMNEKARRLNLHQARFVDATGLSPQNVASAKEVALMALAAQSYPLIRQAAQYSEYPQNVEVPGEDSLALEYKNTNKMLREGRVDAIISKTGYIKESGKCLAWVIPDGPTIIGLSVLGAKSFTQRDDDELMLSQWAPQAKMQRRSWNGARFLK